MTLFGFSLLDISASLGLCATGLLTINFLLGMCLSTPYKKSIFWKKLPETIKTVSLDDLHNWTAYVALIFVISHPLFLIFDPTYKFTLIDVLWPLHAPNQPTIVLLGSISFYALIIVVITTQKIIKRKLSFRVWKNIHLISYGTGLLFLLHGLLMDPELKDRPIDWFDAEKAFSESCLFLVMVTILIRYRYHLRSKNAKLT